FTQGDHLALITRSTFVGNVGVPFGGGALFVAGPTTIANSTFTGNYSTSAELASFGFGGGAIFHWFAPLNLYNDTFAGNIVWSGQHGADIFAIQTVVTTFRNTIMAAGTGDANCSSDKPSGFADGGYNLDSGTSCGFSSANHSLTNTDPKLAALADN